MCLLNRNMCLGHRQASKRIHLGTKWQLQNEEDSQPPHTPLAQTPAASPQSSPQQHPFVLTQGTGKTQTSPSLSPKPTSLSSPCMPLFLVTEAPGNTALPNAGQPRRQQVITFKDV